MLPIEKESLRRVLGFRAKITSMGDKVHVIIPKAYHSDTEYFKNSYVNVSVVEVLENFQWVTPTRAKWFTNASMFWKINMALTLKNILPIMLILSILHRKTLHLPDLNLVI